MQIIKPKKLKKGDTIGILGISGAIKEYEKIENAKKFFENQGYKVKISNTCKSSHRYMAGNCDDECIEALHDYFSDTNINAILCARGGYGTLRLLKKIDWEIIKKNPKIFAGFSDITTLLNMILKKTGLITFHSAMAKGDFCGEIQQYTQDSFFKALEGNLTQIKAEKTEIIKSGSAQGILWGGNLATLTSLCGLDFVPEEDLILIAEDLNEPVYKIDRMFTQLFNTEAVRKRVKGIAVGEFQDIDNEESLNQVLKEIATEYKIPVCKGFKITHGKIKDTIPIGVKTELNSEKGLITLKEKYTE